MEKVSIIVITLNEAQRIGRLLEDLSNQTHQGFEVILVDSQSEDDTCEIALGYQIQLPELTCTRWMLGALASAVTLAQNSLNMNACCS